MVHISPGFLDKDLDENKPILLRIQYCYDPRVFFIISLNDESNREEMGKTGAVPIFPLAIHILIFGPGACYGFKTGYAINLARDSGS